MNPIASNCRAGVHLLGSLAQEAPREEQTPMTKILCVEDNADNLLMLQRRLTRRGFEVTISTDGAESLEWAKTLLPDLIVMDLNLPGLDGWEATRRLKNQPETKHIPIIVLRSEERRGGKEGRDECATDV